MPSNVNLMDALPTMPSAQRADTQLKGSTADAANDQKIDQASKNFEAILLGNWLQHAEETFACVPGTAEEEDEDGTLEMQRNLSVGRLSQALVRAGGVGIASIIAKQLHADHSSSVTSSLPDSWMVSGNLRTASSRILKNSR